MKTSKARERYANGNVTLEKRTELKLELYSIISRSRDSAEADPIVLREAETTRLVFKPLLVNNAQET